jgi:hypothetical protein
MEKDIHSISARFTQFYNFSRITNELIFGQEWKAIANTKTMLYAISI